jgi:hypothetical protein
MGDGSLWVIPFGIIANNRAEHYAKRDSHAISGQEYDRIYKEEYEYTISSRGELIDWAENNMNWSDVEGNATKFAIIEKEVDYQNEWLNGEKDVVDVSDILLK